MLRIYNNVSFSLSREVTRSYSTSFSIAVSTLGREQRDAIYSIYGFVRLADEIVDTFHDFDKQALLLKFEEDYYRAYNEGISLNPVLHAFQITVHRYHIHDELIQAFLNSMKSDLVKTGSYGSDDFKKYIYGSAEAVGLMCLSVFVNGNESEYERLREPAMKLGSAFQKVNFLRDLKNDLHLLDRSYFPGFELNSFDEKAKDVIVRTIEEDFNESLKGIRSLPAASRYPVYIAYSYYLALLEKIRRTPAEKLVSARVRISNLRKMLILPVAYLKVKSHLI